MEMVLPPDSGKVFMPLAAMAAVVATASRTAEATLFLSRRVRQRLMANCQKYPYLPKALRFVQREIFTAEKNFCFPSDEAEERIREWDKATPRALSSPPLSPPPLPAMSSLPPSQAAAAAYGRLHSLLLASTTVPARSGCVGRARRLTLALRCIPIAGHRSAAFLGFVCANCQGNIQLSKLI